MKRDIKGKRGMKTSPPLTLPPEQLPDNVVYMNGVTALNLPPDRILNSATGHLKDVVVIGYDNEGYEYFASSVSSGPEVLWLLERAKKRLLQTVDDEAAKQDE